MKTCTDGIVFEVFRGIFISTILIPIQHSNEV
jgi:hypothetical protein